MCKVTKAKKKEEALKRMKAFGLFKPCIKAFEKYDEIQATEPNGGLYEFSDDEELTAKVKEFEEEYDALVYHVIHTYTQFGELYNFLYVSDYEEEWEFDRADVKAGYAVAYVWNKSDEWCSEIGSIAIREFIGGLVRVG